MRIHNQLLIRSHQTQKEGVIKLKEEIKRLKEEQKKLKQEKRRLEKEQEKLKREIEKLIKTNTDPPRPYGRGFEKTIESYACPLSSFS